MAGGWRRGKEVRRKRLKRIERDRKKNRWRDRTQRKEVEIAIRGKKMRLKKVEEVKVSKEDRRAKREVLNIDEERDIWISGIIGRVSATSRYSG